MHRRLLALAAAVTALAAAPAAGAALDTGVVDVTTNLAYQGTYAAGTGIVLTRSGEILTNNHVIRGATTVRVIDPSTGRRYLAKVIGYSVASDIALLRLKDAPSLGTVTLGRSSSLKVGQRVTALGNAEGANGRPARSTGTITALDRSIVATDGQVSERLTHLIRIDAPLQPGDSGGPLLDAAGRVVGIDTAASVGFYFRASKEGFAIPIDRALAVARQIESGRGSATVHVGSTPFLGVSLSDRGSTGLLVGSVVSGTPAAHAGLVAGDEITALDGKRVSTYSGLSALLLLHRAGDVVKLSWLDGAGFSHTRSVKTASGPPQ